MDQRRRAHARRLRAQLIIDPLPNYSSPLLSSSPPSSSELPPDYPDSADDTDSIYSTPPIHKRLPIYRSSRAAESDSHLDSLLERSVHALEMSNALLQSTLPFQSFRSPSHHDQLVDSALQLRAQSLDYRIRGTRDAQESWMDDLQQLVSSVETLFNDESRNPSNNGHGISTSLPASGGLATSGYRSSPTRPSNNSPSQPLGSPRLHLGVADNAHRSPPPRAMTQYVSVNSAQPEQQTDGDSILLPSTLGLRSASQLSSLPSSSSPPVPKRRSLSHDLSLQRSHSDSKSNGSSSSSLYQHLSQLASQSSSPASSRTSPLSTPRFSRSSFSDSSRSTTRGRRLSSPSRASSSRESSSSRRSRSPRRSLDHRPMTPPIEESASSSSLSSSLDAPQAVQSLRKILQDAPTNVKGTGDIKGKGRSHPLPSIITAMPSHPLHPQEVATTASVSRMLTKSKHHSSTSTPAPTHSSLKSTVPSGQVTPGSPTSSGRCTPRNKVQFAELPESYSSSKPGGKTSKSKSKRSKADENQKWWKSFWPPYEGLPSASVRSPRFEERLEDKVSRSWGRPGFGTSSMDDWAV